MPLSRLRTDERGQALAEFAIVLPLLLALVTAIIDVGITFNHQVTLADAVRSGARVGAVSGAGATATVKNAVKAAGTDLGLTDSNVNVTYTQAGDVVVSATYPYSISVIGFPVYSGNLTSSTTERVEQQ